MRALVLLALTAAAPQALSDDFARGIGPGWALRQEIAGRVATIAFPGRGQVLRATAQGKGAGVSKAALVARPRPMPAGTLVTIAFSVRAPAGQPVDSLQIVDVECATCGEGGNPGVRLYLRRGRWRIDRSKIGIRHAWTRDDAPVLTPDTWHRIVWRLRLGDAATGETRVTMDGREVLSARGATLLPGAAHADRVQIGITANSNPVPATLLFDDIAMTAR